MADRLQDRPQIVKYGVAAIYVSLGLSLLVFLANVLVSADPNTAPRFGAVLGTLLFLFLYSYVVWKAGRGRNWARIVIAAGTLVALASLGDAIVVVRDLKLPPFVVLANVVAWLLAVLGTIALFLPRANAWYRRPVTTTEAAC